MTAKETILKHTEELIEKAEKEGLWFYIPHASAWLSPKELRTFQSQEEVLYVPESMELRNPRELLQELHSELYERVLAIQSIKKRME